MRTIEKYVREREFKTKRLPGTIQEKISYSFFVFFTYYNKQFWNLMMLRLRKVNFMLPSIQSIYTK